MTTGDFYSEPLDIARFLRAGGAIEVLKEVVKEAEEMFKNKGISPIVKQQKVDLFGLDYFFLVSGMLNYVYRVVRNNSGDDNLAQLVADLVKNDFGSKGSIKNVRLLINLFDHAGILLSNQSKKWTYTVQLFTSRASHFLISGVAISNYAFDEGGATLKDKCEYLGGKNNFTLVATGPSVFRKAIDLSMPVFTFKALV